MRFVYDLNDLDARTVGVSGVQVADGNVKCYVSVFLIYWGSDLFGLGSITAGLIVLTACEKYNEASAMLTSPNRSANLFYFSCGHLTSNTMASR